MQPPQLRLPHQIQRPPHRLRPRQRVEKAPLTVSLDGSGSSDLEGSIVSYSWDYGDGSPLGSGVTSSHIYNTPGTYTVTLTVSDGSLTGSATTTITVSNPAGFTVSPILINMNEGEISSFTVVLDVMPINPVIFDVNSSDVNTIGVDQNSLTFNSGNWNIPQTINIDAKDDANTTNEAVEINITVDQLNSDASFLNLAGKKVELTVNDDDIGFTLSSNDITINEGASETFTVVLDGPPSNVVQLDLQSQNSSIATVQQTSISFNTINWNIPQVIVLDGLDDGNQPSQSTQIVVSIYDPGSDSQFDNLPDQTISVNVLNTDPIATFNTSTLIAKIPSTISFDASLSSDQDNDALTYSWNFGDGKTGTGVTTNYVYNSVGTFVVTLTVSDGIVSAQSTVTLTIEPPICNNEIFNSSF